MRIGGLQLGLFDLLMPQSGQPRQPLPPSEIPAQGPSVSPGPPVAVPQSTDDAYAPVHPQANRSLMHEGRKLHYFLRRSHRRSIGLQVGSDGLVVTAPRWALVGDVQQAVAERAAWAVQKLREVREREQAHLRQTIQWANGVCIPYLGQQIRVQLDPTVRSEGCESVQEQPMTILRIRLMPDARSTQIREKVQAWLVARAHEHFAERLDHFAPRLGVSWKRLRLSQARTRWGSANTQGTICLNWRLIHLAPSVIDYVVVHELSHLRVMNHSPAFWDTVASVMPDYAQSLKVLRKETLPPW